MRFPLLLAATLLLTSCTGASVTVKRDLRYLAGTEPRQSGDLYLPAGAGPFPAVLVIHGGGWVRGDRTDGEKFARRLAQHGYAAYNVEYRLAPAHRFPAQLDDVRAALRWLGDNAASLRIDPQRLAVMGYSAGGHLSLMLGLAGDAATPPLRAIVSGAGPSDLSVYPESPYIFDLIGGPPTEFPREYAAASPIGLASAGDPPVYLYHGRLDRLVEVEQSRRMQAALASAGVAVTLDEIPLSGHATTYLFDGALFGRVLGFLDRSLAAP